LNLHPKLKLADKRNPRLFKRIFELEFGFSFQQCTDIVVLEKITNFASHSAVIKKNIERLHGCLSLGFIWRCLEPGPAYVVGIPIYI
jgi:hypothetical protein